MVLLLVYITLTLSLVWSFPRPLQHSLCLPRRWRGRERHFCANEGSCQWENFVQHAGIWAGLQIVYHHEDDEEPWPLDADKKLLCGTALLYSGNELDHINFYVSEELNV